MLDDSLFELDEQFFVNLFNPRNGLITDNQGVVTILDDEPPPFPRITIDIDNVTVSEADETAELTVSLSRATSSIVTVDYRTANGTAISPDDYEGDFATLIFAPGQTSRTINIAVRDDSLIEGDERFFVNLSNPSSNATIGDGRGGVTIKDNDEKDLKISIDDAQVSEADGIALITVRLSDAASSRVEVNYRTANGTATAGQDYGGVSNGQLTFNPGQTRRTIRIPVFEDIFREGNEQFFVNLSNPSSNATIRDGRGIVTIIDSPPPPDDDCPPRFICLNEVLRENLASDELLQDGSVDINASGISADSRPDFLLHPQESGQTDLIPQSEVQSAEQSTLDSDINYDGIVDFRDLEILNANFGTTSIDPNFDPTADINGDGFINLKDLGLLNAELANTLS